jgi:hypothetical protein
MSGQASDTDATSKTRVYRRILVLALVGVVVLLAGCTVTYEATVGSDGGMEEVDIEIDMGEELYQQAQAQAEQEGYDSVGEWFFLENDDSDFDQDAWDSFDIRDDGESTVGVTASGGSPEDLENVTVTVDEDAGEVTYIDDEGIDSSTEGQASDIEIEWEYTVNMPGEIIETNGNADGNTATWNSEDHTSLEQLQVTSEQTGAGGGDDGAFGPGLGVGTALVGILALSAIAAARYRRQ